MGEKTYAIKVEIKWGCPDEQPSDPSFMPDDLITGYNLWSEAGGIGATDQGVLAKICSLVASCLSCTFMPDNLHNGVDDIATDDEIDGEEDAVQAADFFNGCVPTVRASAVFKLPMNKEFRSQDDLDAWQDENDFLDNAISFSFHPVIDSDYIGALWNHQGMTVTLIGQPHEWLASES